MSQGGRAGPLFARPGRAYPPLPPRRQASADSGLDGAGLRGRSLGCTSLNCAPRLDFPVGGEHGAACRGAATWRGFRGGKRRQVVEAVRDGASCSRRGSLHLLALQRFGSVWGKGPGCSLGYAGAARGFATGQLLCGSLIPINKAGVVW